MKNKQVKQMICDVLNKRDGKTKSLGWYWFGEDEAPCLVSGANFMWPSHGVASITASQLKSN